MDTPQTPAVVVTRGTPTDEELAALVTVVSALPASTSTGSDSVPVSRWWRSGLPGGEGHLSGAR